ncbi:hypothetical protein FQN57_001257 [Myotisia sp. PD_48]|nr:hypothetical protein FQN57_001257 [Myotisia sp. PD_48]
MEIRPKSPKQCRVDIGRMIDGILQGKAGKVMKQMIMRRRLLGPKTLSLCDHENTSRPIEGFSPPADCRVDSYEYQMYSGHAVVRRGINKNEEGLWYLNRLCPNMKKRIGIYGKIGSGSFGFVIAGRDKCPNEPFPPKQYAAKVESFVPMFNISKFERAPTCAYREITGEVRFIPAEAVALQLLSGCERFPKVDSIYMHGAYSTIVMSPFSVDEIPLCDQLPATNYPELWFPGYSGYLLIGRKKTKINEIQACKIASHLLEAMVYLMDMNLSHEDLSHWNYLVDENLNTQLIDFGSIYAGGFDNWTSHVFLQLPSMEHFVGPKIAITLAHPYNRERAKLFHGQQLYITRDVRIEHLWKFGVILYDLLHGYSPWEPPQWDDLLGEIKEYHDFEMNPDTLANVFDRRIRIMNEELPVNENLSQDCVDVLRILLAKEEADRTTLVEVADLPWFQGHWVDHSPQKFKRPLRP